VQRRYLIATLAALAIAALALAGCSSGGSSELVSQEGPVPEGMPVMYEFFTPT
jgi:hypothetical protein